MFQRPRTVVAVEGSHGRHHQHQGGRAAGWGLAGHGEQCAQPARHGRRPRPGSGCSRRSTSSATSATTRPASCAPGAAARWRSSSWTWPTRSSPTWSAAPRRPSRRRRRWSMVCNSGEDAGRERRHLDLLEEQRVLGVLITPVDDGADARGWSGSSSAASRWCSSTAAPGSTTAARSRSTTSSAAGWPASTCASGATGGSRSSAARSRIPQVADRHAGLAAALRGERRAAASCRRPT